jgi:SNF2 family DNA or RNA helicase
VCLTLYYVQNNLTELWSLLHFILPEIFQELETFKTWFDFDEQLNSAGGAQKIIDVSAKSCMLTYADVC